MTVAKRQSRRSQLKFRVGIDRDIPICIVNMDVPLSPRRSTITARLSHDAHDGDVKRISNLTHWTIVEGIPERWMDQPRRRSTEFHFTPIEGVPERMMEINATPHRMSAITDIEGVPERQCIVPNEIKRPEMRQSEVVCSTGDATRLPSNRQGSTKESRAKCKSTEQQPAFEAVVPVDIDDEDEMVWEATENGDAVSHGTVSLSNGAFDDDPSEPRSSMLHRQSTIIDDAFPDNEQDAPDSEGGLYLEAEQSDEDITFVGHRNEEEDRPDSPSDDAPKRSSLLGKADPSTGHVCSCRK